MQVLSVRSIAAERTRACGQASGSTCPGLARGMVLPIWPPVSRYVEWPPTRTMSHQDVEDLAG